MTTAEISRMSVSERLQAMEKLWDSLTHETTEINSPDWHSEVLKDRQKKIENGEAEFISLAELKSKK